MYKKKKIISVVKKNKIKVLNKNFIKEILDGDELDSIIEKVTNDKIKIIKSPIISKGYLTGYEQFISILDNFIIYTLNYVNSPELIKEIIVNCLKESKILLSKRYYYDVENIDYYKYNFDFSISIIFYNNLIILNNQLKEELDKVNISIEDIDIQNKNDILCLINFLEELIFVNKNDYKILSLFTPLDNNRRGLYVNWYKMLISKHISNIDFIKAYRKYKNNEKKELT